MTIPTTAFSRVFARAFSSSPIASASSKDKLHKLLSNIPTYPHPIKHTFKQSWFGLYGGKHIQFGNNVPESEYKTRRRWLPNVRHTKLFSEALGQSISLNVTTSVLRTIDKVGGLDNYLLGSKAARVKELGPTGWKLRYRVMSSPWYKKKAAAEVKALGVADAPVKAAAALVTAAAKEAKQDTTPGPRVVTPIQHKDKKDEAGDIRL